MDPFEEAAGMLGELHGLTLDEALGKFTLREGSTVFKLLTFGTDFNEIAAQFAAAKADAMEPVPESEPTKQANRPTLEEAQAFVTAANS